MESIDTNMNDKSTGFVGFMLKEKRALGDLQDFLIRHFGSKFKYQPYLHTTMIYLSDQYVNDTEKLLSDEHFINEINKFRDAVCIFDGLKLIYKFEKPELKKILRNLTLKYERRRHSRYLHVTIGSFFNVPTKIFIDNYALLINEAMQNFKFVIQIPEVIRVDSDKKYYKYRDLLRDVH
jgi:hypothetical protein